jgi:hypothetical protein
VLDSSEKEMTAIVLRKDPKADVLVMRKKTTKINVVIDLEVLVVVIAIEKSL